jgi:hypothetical protein
MRITVIHMLIASVLFSGTAIATARADKPSGSIKPAYIPHAESVQRHGSQRSRPLHASMPLDVADDSFLTQNPGHCSSTARMPIGGTDGNHLTSW